MANLGSWQHYNRDASISITLLGVFFVGLRFLSRHLGKVPLGLEDGLIVAAVLNLFVIFALDIEMVKYGLGLHQSTISMDSLITINKLLLPAEIFYCTSIILTKTSILAMYHRIFHIHRPTRIAVYILGVITIIRAISLIFASIFQCTPVARAWDKFQYPGRCINLKDTFIANDVVNAITDVVILGLLIGRVWKVQAGYTRPIERMVCNRSLFGDYLCVSPYSTSTGKSSVSASVQQKAVLSGTGEFKLS
ncbi:short chain dehydrogenase family protein [Aspergillus niger]|uniref:Short chain dehydrogenase family protein n=1 Tax=Aspergillus niger TaxID=5061 RepID=A0A505HTW5_ASPNG|nr:short chain dehydrogenase family protein [Aspergillus niger]